MKKFLYLCRQNLFTMRKTLLFLTAVCFSIANANALNTNVKQELKTLEQALSQRPWIEEQKRVKIDSLNRAAALSSAPYEIYKQLYEEYRSYNYDTALLYVRFMEREATSDRQPEVQLSRAFVYLSGGLFKEASDILEQPALAFHLSPFAFHLSPFAFQPTDLTREYLTTRVRLLWDLADNAGGEIGETYNAEGLRLNREQQRYLSPADTAQYWYSAAMIDLREGNYPRAIERLQVSLAATQPSVHYRAMVASTLAYAYRMTGNNDAALHYYIDAAVSDIRSSTYETVALRNIAEILFEDGETTLADRYIHLAMQDATNVANKGYATYSASYMNNFNTDKENGIMISFADTVLRAVIQALSISQEEFPSGCSSDGIPQTTQALYELAELIVQKLVDLGVSRPANYRQLLYPAFRRSHVWCPADIAGSGIIESEIHPSYARGKWRLPASGLLARIFNFMANSRSGYNTEGAPNANYANEDVALEAQLPLFANCIARGRSVPISSSSYHWSSTEYPRNNARLVYFANGNAYNSYKYYGLVVRPVAAFRFVP